MRIFIGKKGHFCKGLPGASLVVFIKKILSAEKIKKSVNIIFIDDSIMSGLNRRFRNKRKTTDVLSFPFDEKDFLGEIYISVPMAQKQARDGGYCLELELKRLIAHGIFHLLGLKHKTRKEEEKMRKKESAYLPAFLFEAPAE